MKCFASWLGVARKTSTYVVRFQSNAQLHWQRRSLEALRFFAPEVVRVQSDSASASLGGNAPADSGTR
jgi:hypothetical protein